VNAGVCGVGRSGGGHLVGCMGWGALLGNQPLMAGVALGLLVSDHGVSDHGVSEGRGQFWGRGRGRAAHVAWPAEGLPACQWRHGQRQVQCGGGSMGRAARGVEMAVALGAAAEEAAQMSHVPLVEAGGGMRCIGCNLGARKAGGE